MVLKTINLSLCDDQTVYRQVREQCEEFGFVKFTGHGLSDALIGEAFAWARRFFHLPEHVKQAANRPPGPGPNRGYAAVGKEKLSGISGYSKGVIVPKMVEDVKESFDLGPKHDKKFPTPWPAEDAIPGFQTFMRNFYDQCNQVNMRILHILELALRLDDTRLTALSTDGNAEVRVTHYPPVQLGRLRTGKTFRIAEHTDVGTLTLLFQDSVGGLEVEHQRHHGEFLPVFTSSRSEMIVNVGDTLQNWTGGKLRSANHRVVAPPGSEASPDYIVPSRISVAFFAKANASALIRPLDEYIDSNEAIHHFEDAVTAAEYYSGMQTKTFPEAEVSA